MSAPQSSAPSDAPRFKVGDRVRQTTMRKGVVEGRGSYRQPYLVKFDDGGRAWLADVELAPLSASTDSPTNCWRCKKRPGVVFDGTAHSCVECAGETARNMRDMLSGIDDAVREGLPAWPRMMDRVEFIRECVKLHREAASAAPRSGLSYEEANRMLDELTQSAITSALRSASPDSTTLGRIAAAKILQTARAALLRALTGETTETR